MRLSRTRIRCARGAGLSVAAAAAVAVAAGVGGSARAATSPASLTRIACHSAIAPLDNEVSVTSVMRHLPGTRRLAVRFTLLQSTPGEPTLAVSGGDLGRWISPTNRSLGSEPADVWRLSKVVADVGVPASYRFRVAFRWLGADGVVLAQRSLSTGSCHVRELRPDVLVRGVTVTALSSAARRDRYVATIANDGGSATGPFSVLFTPGGGGASLTRALTSLRPGASRRVAFDGPVCAAADPPLIVADPSDQVDDFDRANNTFSVVCPPSP